MEGKIDLEIVTPKGRALTAQVDEVTAPGADGEFGVMPGHLPLLAAIRTGLVSYRVGQDQKRCAIGSGFAEAGADKLVILTDEYIEREGIDPVLVRKELGEVQKELETLLAKIESSPDEEARKKYLIGRENWCAAELELYGDPPPPTMRPQTDYVSQDKQVVTEESEHEDQTKPV
jgi:F-type H+-transporting ATPase subunit epsilon